MAEIVYDDDEIQVLWYPGESDFAVVTFGDAVTLADGVRFFADTPIAKLGLTAIGIMAKTPNWFPRSSVLAAQQAIEAKLEPYYDRIGYGGSMGGYGAIKYSRLLRTNHTLAFCPQWTLDKKECGETDPGWQENFRPEIMSGMGIQANDVSGQLILFYDPAHPVDTYHARAIFDKAEDCHMIRMPNAGHHITSIMAGTANLRVTLDATLMSDTTAINSAAQGLRRRSAFRHLPLAESVLLHKKSRASKFAKKILNSPHPLPVDYRLRSCLSSALSFSDNEAAVYDYAKMQVSSAGSLEDKFRYSLLFDASTFRLVTAHGTQLFYDPVADAVVHRAHGGSNGVPVSIEVKSPTEAYPTVTGGIGRAKLAILEHGAVSLKPSGEPTEWLIGVREGGALTFQSRGLYLCANIDGTVSCDRPNASEWEQFHLVIEGGKNASLSLVGGI